MVSVNFRIKRLVKEVRKSPPQSVALNCLKEDDSVLLERRRRK